MCGRLSLAGTHARIRTASRGQASRSPLLCARCDTPGQPIERSPRTTTSQHPQQLPRRALREQRHGSPATGSDDDLGRLSRPAHPIRSRHISELVGADDVRSALSEPNFNVVRCRLEARQRPYDSCLRVGRTPSQSPSSVRARCLLQGVSIEFAEKRHTSHSTANIGGGDRADVDDIATSSPSRWWMPLSRAAQMDPRR